MDVDLSDITERGDRKHTQRLLALLQEPELAADLRDEIADALGACEDPRAVAPLTRILEDVALPVDVREAAGRALAGYVFEVEDAKLRRWWGSPDEVLQHHAMALMDADQCRDVVLSIAQTPQHRLHAAALASMSTGFWRPEQQAFKIRGLAHPDPEVRAAAASALCMDEPLAAEAALIRCLTDNSPKVVAAAAATLEYYPSVRVLGALHPLASATPDSESGNANQARAPGPAEACWEALRDSVRHSLIYSTPQASSALRGWLEPAWSLLAFDSEELRPAPKVRGVPAPARPRRSLPLAELQALLADPCTPARTLRELRDVDIHAYDSAQISRMLSSLANSADPVCRDLAVDWCSVVGDVPRLLELTQDPAILVRKSAMFALASQQQDPTLAPHILTYLHRADVRGTMGAEALRSYAHHAPGEEALATLAAFAGDAEQDEDLRYTAVYCLNERAAHAALESLLGILDETPVVTWALHIALLDSARSQRLPVRALTLEVLGEVDNLDLRLALAQYQHDA